MDHGLSSLMGKAAADDDDVPIWDAEEVAEEVPSSVCPSAPTAASEVPPVHLPAAKPAEDVCSLDDLEKNMIRQALEKNNGRRKAAAEQLGISERTLYRKIKEYKLED